MSRRRSRASRRERREEVEKTQHSADVSLVWFEHVKRFWDMDPTRFAFGLMTRSKAITYDNLALRAPEFVQEVDRLVARDARALGFPVDTTKPVAPMFQPFRLRNMTLENRVVVSPMCQYSSQDGMPADWHLVHLRLARDRRRRPDVHRDDRRVGAGAHLARLHRHVQRRARGGLEAHRRFRACAVDDQVLHAAWPCRPQGRDQADVGRHRRAAGAGRLADHLGVATALFSAQRGPAGNVPRRHGADDRRLRGGDQARPTAPASTWSSCTRRTATCCRASSRR